MVQKYIAKEGVASALDTMILGAILRAFVENIRAEDLKPLLQKYNLESIDPTQWYPEQLALDFEFAVERSEINSIENLVAIGIKLVGTAPFPADVSSVEEAINALNDKFKQVYRNRPEDARLFIVERGANHLIVTVNMPYPKDLVYGYLWSLTKRYRPAAKSFFITDAENPQPEEFPGRAFKISWK